MLWTMMRLQKMIIMMEMKMLSVLRRCCLELLSALAAVAAAFCYHRQGGARRKKLLEVVVAKSGTDNRSLYGTLVQWVSVSCTECAMSMAMCSRYGNGNGEMG